MKLGNKLKKLMEPDFEVILDCDLESYARIAYCYSSQVLKRQWTYGEKWIIENPIYSAKYSYYVLGRTWGKVLKKDKNFRRSYNHMVNSLKMRKKIERQLEMLNSFVLEDRFPEAIYKWNNG